jgi:uncharacterized protein YndB with AHSA1/START domain
VKRDVVLERTYPYPPERVWRALTDSKAMSEWLMPNDFMPKLGHRFQMKTRPRGRFDGTVHCEVTVLEAPRTLAYTWVGGGSHWVVTWTLTPVAGGTKLTLTHAGFTGLRELGISVIMGAGWKKMLGGRFPDVLSRLDEPSVTPRATVADGNQGVESPRST